jgi:hypothetical protein
MSPKGDPKDGGARRDSQAKAQSKAVAKVERQEAKKGLPPGRGVGRRIHEGRREGA